MYFCSSFHLSLFFPFSCLSHMITSFPSYFFSSSLVILPLSLLIFSILFFCILTFLLLSFISSCISFSPQVSWEISLQFFSISYSQIFFVILKIAILSFFLFSFLSRFLLHFLFLSSSFHTSRCLILIFPFLVNNFYVLFLFNSSE